MGTALTGNTIASSYLGLLKSTDSLAISTSAKRITDGAGNDLPIKLTTSQMFFNVGTVSAPALSFDGNTSEGFYIPTDENIGVTVGGTEVARFLSTGLSLTSSKLTLSNDQKIRWTSDDVYIQGTTSSDNIQLGVGGSTQFTFAQTTGLRLHQYGGGSITGTVTQRLGVTSTGQVVEIPIGAGAVDGTGTAGKIVKWSDSDTITDSLFTESTDGVNLADNKKLFLGTGNDAEILYDGSNLLIKTNGFDVYNSVGNEFMIQANENASVQLYFNGTSKLQTSDTGVSIFGDETITGSVGIGHTSTPSNTLHVKGATTVALFEGTGGNVFLQLKDFDDSTSAFIGVDGGVLKFQTSGSSFSDKLTIDTSGNAVFSADVSAVSLNLSDFAQIKVDDAELYWTNTANTDYWRWKRDASNNFTLDHFNGSSNNNALSFDSSQDATFSGNVTMSQSNASSSDLINQNTHGTGTSRFIAQSNTTDQNAQLVSDDSNNISWVGTSTGGTNRIVFINDTNAYYEGGNFLIGKTSNTLATAGAKLGTGGSNFTRDSAEVVFVNRTTDDGSAITIAKDGTSVGVIGTQKWGIGTASPDKPLHISSSDNQLARFESTDAYAGIELKDNGSSTLPPLISALSDDLIFYGGNSTTRPTIMFLDSSSSSVGIGETSPDLQLHIKSTATGSTGIAIENTNNAQNLDIDFYNNAGSAQGRIRYEEGAGALNFSPNVSSPNAMYINYSNNIGIGTTLPESKTHIIDTTNPATTSGSLIVEGRRDGGANVLTLRAKDASNASDALPNGQGAVMRFQGFDGSDFENMGYIFTGADGQAVANGDAPSFMAFGTSADGSSSPTERVRFESDGTVQITNSTSPKLQLKRGTKEYTSRVDNNNKFVIQEEGGNEFFVVESGASSNTIRIDSSGNVGIGETSPATNLDIKDASGSTDLRLRDSGDNTTLFLQAQNGISVISTVTDHPLRFDTNDTERMRVSNDGLVSIKNASTPTLRLDNTDTSLGTDQILGTLEFNQNDPSSDGVGVVAKINALNESSFAGIGALTFHTGSATSISEKARLDSSGRLGIRNPNPTVALDVLGTDNLSSRFIFTKDLSTDKVLFGGADHDTFGAPFIGSSSAHSFTITQGGGAAITIDTSKNVGIGTTAPFCPLQIAKSSSTSNTGNDSSFSLCLSNTDDTNNNLSLIGFNDGSNALDGQSAVIGCQYIDHTNNYGDLLFITRGAGGYDERLRIKNDGALRIATTSHVWNDRELVTMKRITGEVYATQTDDLNYSHWVAKSNAASSSTHFMAYFVKSDNSNVGSITHNDTNTSFNTSSDYRLKEDLKDFNALEIASNIKMYDFKWKEADSRSYGVMAHELQEVLPQAVVGDKNGKDMQGVDYSKLVPILLKSIQELEARVQELEKEI